jgi:hypothetical protein
VKLEKRVDRAHALVLAGTIYQKVNYPSHKYVYVHPTNVSRPNEILTRKETTWLLSS